MEEGLGVFAVIGAIFVGLFHVCAAVYRVGVFVIGLRWLTSRKVRERTAAEGSPSRFLAFEGVVTVVMVVVILAVGVVVALLARK